MEIKESFIIHTEWIEDLPEEYKTKFLMYIYNYGSRGDKPDLEGLEKTLWKKIERRIDEDQVKWESVKVKRSESGKRGAANRWSKEPVIEDHDADAIQYQMEMEKKPSRKFKKPTVEEILEYCRERNNTINAQHFYDYYEANGWKVGKNSMKDWKATIRTWEQRQKQPYGNTVRELPEGRITL